MEMRILEEPVLLAEIARMAEEQFGEMVKAVVDVERGVLIVGGELHADGEAALLEKGSKQEHLWGINLYPKKPPEEWIEFDAMINVRPSQGNRSRGVENEPIRLRIRQIITRTVRRTE